MSHRSANDRLRRGVRGLGWLVWPLVGLGVGVRFAIERYDVLQRGTGEGRGLALFYFAPLWAGLCVAGFVGGLIVAFVVARALRPRAHDGRDEQRG